VGLQIIGLLAATTAISLGLRAAANSQIAAQKPVVPPARIGAYRGVPGPEPIADAARNRPPAVYRFYQSGDRVPVYVSVARVTTLNALRIPHRYLLDTDGRIIEHQEAIVPRIGENRAVYDLLITQGRGDAMMQLHWMQAPGQEPIPEPLEAPGLIAAALLAHAPVYICDVWMPFQLNARVDELEKTLNQFAVTVDKQIRSGHAP
jgi:hypothetical protein